jgi:hypothetical protein
MFVRMLAKTDDWLHGHVPYWMMKPVCRLYEHVVTGPFDVECDRK